MSGLPNINFGTPAIFFDSHPEQQETYLGSYWNSFIGTLKIAWTGDVPKQLNPGTLRIVWWTTDNNRGLKDYELHQYDLVKTTFDQIVDIPELRRCLVMGFSGQNPYTMTYGGDNPWVERDKKLARMREREERWARQRANRLREGEFTEEAEAQDRQEEEDEERSEKRIAQDQRKKGNILQQIDDIIQSNEDAEKQRLLDVDREDV